MVFGREVINRRVEIRYTLINDDGSTQQRSRFYAGTVVDCDDRNDDVIHKVRFDDGDQEWLDLMVLQEAGDLHWL